MPERANLVARIRGTRRRPVAGTALAHRRRARRPAEWERGPFGGELVGGRGVGARRARHEGRGGGVSAVAIATLAREGWRGRGDLIFIAAADEEVGDGLRARVARRGASGRRARGLLGERGRRRPRRARRPRAVPLLDGREDDGAVHAARARPQRPRARCRRSPTTRSSRRRRSIERLGAVPAPSRSSSPRSKASCRPRSARSRRPATRSLRRASSLRSPRELVEPLLAMTVSPTMARASDKRNVIPAVCEITIDVRLLPGPDPGRGRGDAPRLARRRRLRARQHRGARRDAVADRRAAVGRRESFVDAEEPGRGRGADLRRRASPTRTGCATRSAPSPTGSSRRAR